MKKIYPLIIALVLAFTALYPAKSLMQAPADREPVFAEGGLQGFREWVEQGLMWPSYLSDIARSRGLKVDFSIDPDGKVTEVKVMNAPHDALAEEIVRIMLQSPAWVPGLRGGQPAKIRLGIPLYGKDRLPGYEPTVKDSSAVVSLQPVPIIDSATGKLNRPFVMSMLRRLQYPQQAFEDGAEGAVMVWFDTYRSGWLASFTTSESSSPAFSEEVIRVMNGMVVSDSVGGVRPQGPSRLLNVEFSIRYNRDNTGLHPLRQVKLSEVPLADMQ